MTPESVLLAASLTLVALSAVGLWLLRPNGWLTKQLNAAMEPQ